MNTTTHFRISLRNSTPHSLNFHPALRGIVLFLVFGGYLFNSRISFAQGCKDRPVYTCRLPLNEKTYTCEMPVSNCKNNIFPIRETAKDTAVKPVTIVYRKCGLMQMRDVQVETKEEPTVKENEIIEPVKGEVAVEQPSVTGCVLFSINPIPVNDIQPAIADTLVELITVIEEVPFVELVQDPPYSCMLVEPYLIEEEAPSLKGEMQDDNSSLQGGGQAVLTCYPNPTSNGLITLHYSIHNSLPDGEGWGGAMISLFDMSGNLAKTLLAPQNLIASDYQSQFDLSDLQDGIYFCRLISGNNKTTTRIVISK